MLAHISLDGVEFALHSSKVQRVIRIESIALAGWLSIPPCMHHDFICAGLEWVEGVVPHVLADVDGSLHR